MTRIEQLKPSAQRQWGQMDIAQMMAHCSAALEMASGKFVAKRTLSAESSDHVSVTS